MNAPHTSGDRSAESDVVRRNSRNAADRSVESGAVEERAGSGREARVEKGAVEERACRGRTARAGADATSASRVAALQGLLREAAEALGEALVALRVVVEALAIGTPVVGYAHGGVGELLGELFPAGRTQRGDIDALAARIDAVLAERPAVAPFAGHRLADMEAATLALYRSVVGG